MTGNAQVLATPDGPLRFTITHRPRITRRMHLEIDDAGELRVVVPGHWPDFYTRRLLRKHLVKVRRFLGQARGHALEPLCYADGAKHLYRGRAITLDLKIGANRATGTALRSGVLRLGVPSRDSDQVRRRLRAWYRAEAETLFAERLGVWRARASWTRDRPLRLRLRRMRRTWGTCSRDGVIRLNTHLVKAPPSSLDYVIAHELCHVREMNHGRAFYDLQERLYPGWRSEREHLRAFGARYTQE